MAKKKKTRKQKRLADMRHKEYTAQPLEPIQSERNESQKIYPSSQPIQPKKEIITTHYSYLYSDLAKTLILTISVIVVELVLRYFAFGA